MRFYGIKIETTTLLSPTQSKRCRMVTRDIAMNHVTAHTLPLQQSISPRSLAGNNLNITFLSMGNSSLVANNVKQAINTWLKLQAGNCYDESIQRLAPRYEKCFKNDGIYIEK